MMKSQPFDLHQNQAYTMGTEVVVATNHKRASEVTTLIWKSKVSVSNGKLGGTARSLPARASALSTALARAICIIIY